MKLRSRLNPTRRRVNLGAALILTLVFTAVGLMVLGSALNWGSNNASIIERNNQYFKALSAAEAATERVVAGIVADYQTNGEAGVYNKLTAYAACVPTSSDDPYWANYQFNNAQGVTNTTYVSRTVDPVYTNVGNQYALLRGMSATYRVVSNARAVNYPIVGGIKQEIQVSTVPIFQFAIFYTVDLEINPGANMEVTGRVHSNNDIYCQPDGATLTFRSDVTACGGIFLGKKPGDGGSRNTGNVVFLGQHTGNNSTLTLPIGTNNTPEAVYEILKPPPASETSASPMYTNRYYNKADLVILVSNTTVTAKAGGTTIPWAQISNFVSTNLTFRNKREDKTIQTTQIDVGKLTQWAHTNATIAGTVGNDNLDSIYVADYRSVGSDREHGVRLANGATLPPDGLTVASPNPVYIQGHYNAPTATERGTHNTGNTKPASIAADAITILSENWLDGRSNDSVDNRPATATTVNAAFLSGIVPTSEADDYSGGVENFPRFLEKWSNVPFTYNGSMVVMFYSQQAISPWKSHTDVYVPPIRAWAFDVNFMDATKLPPDTPQFRKISRWLWSFMAPNTIN